MKGVCNILHCLVNTTSWCTCQLPHRAQHNERCHSALCLLITVSKQISWNNILYQLNLTLEQWFWFCGPTEKMCSHVSLNVDGNIWAAYLADFQLLGFLCEKAWNETPKMILLAPKTDPNRGILNATTLQQKMFFKILVKYNLNLFALSDRNLFFKT